MQMATATAITWQQANPAPYDGVALTEETGDGEVGDGDAASGRTLPQATKPAAKDAGCRPVEAAVADNHRLTPAAPLVLQAKT